MKPTSVKPTRPRPDRHPARPVLPSGLLASLRPALLPALFLVALLLPASPAAAELGYEGWGLRGGVASDPDQGIVGVHLDLGEITDSVRIQPSLDLGFGDADSVQLLVPAQVVFATAGDWTPYVGGGVMLAWVDYDEPRRGPFGSSSDDDADFDIAPVAVGGVELALDGRNDLLVELQVGGSEAFDAKVVVGWSF